MIWLLLIAAFLCLVAAVWLRWRSRNRRLLEIGKKLPGPPTMPVLGNAWQFMGSAQELVTTINSLTTDYGDVMRFWLGPDLNIVIRNPDDLKTVLSSMKTTAKGPQYKYMADYLGGGILSGSGPAWRRHRKIANPNYGKRAIESYSDVFNQEVDLLLEKLRTYPRNHQFDIYKDVVKTTSYAVCRTLMGLTREETIALPYLHTLINGTPMLYDIVFDRMTKWYLQIDPVFWMTNYNTCGKTFKHMMREFSKRIVVNRLDRLNLLEDQRKLDLMANEEDSSSNTQLSVIDRFLLSQELSGDELLNETFTIFTSSQEASAKIASFVILMMAYHQDCQDKLYAEILSVFGDEDRHVTDKDIRRMPYLEMIFKEVLRLFPIGAILQRTVVEDISISAGTLPAGCSIVAPIYHMHRDPRFWSRPNNFDPERFTPENIAKRQPNCYIPFSIGPMDCLGRYFGTKLVKTTCIRILREFHVTSLETYDMLKIVIAISAISCGGYPVILSPRQKNK